MRRGTGATPNAVFHGGLSKVFVKPILAAADWRMTWAFVAAVVGLVSFMKAVSLRCSRRPVRNRLFFLLSPLPSVDSWRRVVLVTADDVRQTFKRCVLGTGAFLICHWIYWRLVTTLNLSGWSLSYLGAPLVWLMGEAGGPIARAFYLPAGGRIPLPHDGVLASRSVADFWGNRWNVWFSDWFRQVIFRRRRARPATALMQVFLVSGLFHEIVLNLNLWLLTGHAPFGSMMLYFGLQALGILAERKWLPKYPTASVSFTWLVVLGPAPLIVNEALLRILQLWR